VGTLGRMESRRTDKTEETHGVKQLTRRGHVIIERVEPQLDCGRFPAKAVVGERVEVTCDIFRDGPPLLSAVLRYRGPSDQRWQETPMSHLENDRWYGSFRPSEIGTYRYTVEAWTDAFETWRRGLLKYAEAGADISVELIAGAELMESRLKSVPAARRPLLEVAIETMRRPAETEPGAEGLDPRVAPLLDEEVLDLMRRHADRKGSTTYKPVLEMTVDRERARFGAWYEFFPRSTGTPNKHGTFETAAKHLPRIAEMGFDIVYLPPIHPIGATNRKGRNNTLVAGPGDIGSPWAIGNAEGGHDAVHPELGTIQDFDRFVAAAERLGLEVCLDFAIQCSPDHPWVKEHPEWFHHQPDGTIKYAENPPKKYQDIYPVNFDTDDREGLWSELRRVLEFWIDHGVKVFRVDNPHTKSFHFWEWVIGELKAQHPDLIFLAEAFTKPKVMQYLAKLGFTQSYTYFTWRNAKWELEEYLTELTTSEMRHYYRPNFFANTPDILHEYLQVGGPPAFKIRLVLAAMMSPSYGIYSGYELYENTPLRKGSEEYLNSEKFELKVRDYSAQGSLIPYIRKVNEIRRKHPAFSELTNLRFHEVDKDNLIAFSKTAAGGDPFLVVVNLNPFNWEEGTIAIDRAALGVEPGRPLEMHDLVTDATYTWHGDHAYVRLDPAEPAHIFQVRA
jgi:starch synthase (maltosyl-transferring)